MNIDNTVPELVDTLTKNGFSVRSVQRGDKRWIHTILQRDGSRITACDDYELGAFVLGVLSGIVNELQGEGNTDDKPLYQKEESFFDEGLVNVLSTMFLLDSKIVRQRMNESKVHTFREFNELVYRAACDVASGM